ncbi:hypothetical protein [Halalkalibacterium ligniniphilum]|uniref:hypothetical protein n=1 Tax=Halalkalibacterium ligniniphilum TaxID=1134413 RepID=UPI000347119E|nr:hypothetical protein [Halalkalibacterium ligniniphilum]
MQFDGAVVREQGVTFAIVVVKSHVLNSSHSIDEARTGFSRHFPGMPLILMAQNSRGRPTYQGRKDIVNFLSKIDPSRIPWKRYTV